MAGGVMRGIPPETGVVELLSTAGKVKPKFLRYTDAPRPRVCFSVVVKNKVSTTITAVIQIRTTFARTRPWRILLRHLLS